MDLALQESSALLAAAAGIGLLHTLIGPDHYVPFLALARARGWSLRRTLLVTAVCGAGHVLGSLILGVLGIALGWAATGMAGVESLRGAIATWLLLGFGLAYTLWGLRRAARDRPHAHAHAHADGTSHHHRHRHRGGHVHVHAADTDSGRAGITPWAIFVVFVFGPCEALIPLLMLPAATGDWWGVGAVGLVFGVATVGTMAALVALGHLGMARLPLGPLERYSHALAGLALVACGLAIRLGL